MHSFEVYAVVRAGVVSGTLDYRLSYDSATQIVRKPFAIGQANQVNVSADHLIFGARRVEIWGLIKSADGGSASATQIVLGSPEAGPLCTDSGTSYSCTVDVTTLNAFVTEYQVAGAWGVTRTTFTVPAGALGGLTSLRNDITVGQP